MGGAAERGFTVWLVGAASAARTTLARGVERELRDRGRYTVMLEDEALHEHLWPEASAGEERRIAWLCGVLDDAGVTAVVVAGAGRRPGRDFRARLPGLVEVRVDAGGAAEAWEEAPPDVAVCPERDTPEACVGRILDVLREASLI